MGKNLKSKTLSGFMWRFAERCGAQGVTFIVQILLARMLAPEAFGIVALIIVFTDILQTFVDSGFANALIQKKDADDLDFSSVFYFNIVLCVSLYLIMFFLAPVIDKVWYAGKYDNLTQYIRILCLIIVVSGLKNVQQAYVSRKMIFRKFFFATLGGTCFSAILGIVTAYLGFGVWAIIVQRITNELVNTIILWITVKWRPKLQFSFSRLKGLLSYGWKLFCSGLIDKIYNEVRQLLIGSLYSASDLAYYNQSKRIPNMVVTNINTSIDSVLFPAMSEEQDDKSKVKSMMRRSIKTSRFIMWPIMLGVFAIAEPLISLLLTDKWLPCVPYLRVFCITYAFMPIHTANLNAIKAMGRSDIFLKLEIVKKTLGVALLVSTMCISVYAMALSLLISTALNTFVNAFPNKKLLNYSYFEQIKDILPSIAISLFMAVVVYLIGLIKLPLAVILLIQICSGGIIYLGLSYLFKLESFTYLLGMIKNIIKSKRA